MLCSYKKLNIRKINTEQILNFWIYGFTPIKKQYAIILKEEIDSIKHSYYLHFILDVILPWRKSVAKEMNKKLIKNHLPLTVIRWVFSADLCLVPSTRQVYSPVSLDAELLIVSTDCLLPFRIRTRLSRLRDIERRPKNHLNLISAFSLELYLHIKVIVVPVRTNSVGLSGSVIANPPVCLEGLNKRVDIFFYE